ncbi:MAG: hypothetical protein IH969_07290, partial [Candidatus Krumholzibacteriota bacterium]|nr:hypothetical protein [Candidatus Krumholzibacteriota bacterium]
MYSSVCALLAGIVLFASCSDPLSVDGPNEPPAVLILSPAPNGVDPTEILTRPTLFIKITDPDDPAADLSFRWSFVRTSPFDEDWVATEDSVISHRASLAWSDWHSYAPSARGMSVAVSDSLGVGFYVLAVEARDPDRALSDLNDDNVRRVQARVCDVVNDPPVVEILVPDADGLNPALVPPIFQIRFVASDLDNAAENLSVRWALVDTRLLNEDWLLTIDFLRKTPAAIAEYERIKLQWGEVVDGESDSEAQWSAWVPYETGAPGAQGYMEVTTPPLDFGPYIFAVQTRDPCGGFMEELDEMLNVQRIRVTTQHPLPILTVCNPHVGTVVSSIGNLPVIIADILSGIAMKFEWTADWIYATEPVFLYRYGWDILDLNDDSQWDIDFTLLVDGVASAPPRTFFFGTHTFHVEVNNGFFSRVEIKLNIIPYVASRELLLVDDFAADQASVAGWDDVTGNGILPSDEEHDRFWLDMLDNVDGFDPGFDVMEVNGSTPIPLTTLAYYKNIIWSVFTDAGQVDDLPLLYEYLHYRKRNPYVWTQKRESNA